MALWTLKCDSWARGSKKGVLTISQRTSPLDQAADVIAQAFVRVRGVNDAALALVERQPKAGNGVTHFEWGEEEIIEADGYPWMKGKVEGDAGQPVAPINPNQPLVHAGFGEQVHALTPVQEFFQPANPPTWSKCS